ncbi:MAG: phosphoadenosine phosphosulfate reductase family protein [Methanobrevibacter sp.]|nr:phosphoadenosine phosphosulfate reductase family protein [Methanobrevibacter sp.]
MSNPVIITKSNRPYQICKCCVMDTSDEDIIFDDNGICMRCNDYKNRIEPKWNHGRGHEKELKELISAIKKSGKGKKYDCILGLSGGLDSSYLLHLAVKEWGLHPYVFHIDCGWNLPVAEENIERLASKLNVEVHTKHMDWDELREMQLAWFRTGLEALDAPQDHAFIALIDELSLKIGVKYILNGWNITTEAIADPASWGKGAGPTGDSTYIKDVIKKYCSIPIKKYTFTNGIRHKFVIPYIKGVKTIKPLNFVEFTK